MNLKDKPSQLISIKSTEGEHYVMPVNNILYIEHVKNTHNCKVSFYSHESRNIETRTTLRDFEEVLPNQFVKINRSMLVNINVVISYNDDYVTIWTFADWLEDEAPETQKLPLTFDISHKFVEL